MSSRGCEGPATPGPTVHPTLCWYWESQPQMQRELWCGLGLLPSPGAGEAAPSPDGLQPQAEGAEGQPPSPRRPSALCLGRGLQGGLCGFPPGPWTCWSQMPGPRPECSIWLLPGLPSTAPGLCPGAVAGPPAPGSRCSGHTLGTAPGVAAISRRTFQAGPARGRVHPSWQQAPDSFQWDAQLQATHPAGLPGLPQESSLEAR